MHLCQPRQSFVLQRFLAKEKHIFIKYLKCPMSEISGDFLSYFSEQLLYRTHVDNKKGSEILL